MKWIRLLLLMALVVSFAAPARAQTGNDSEMVGSVLVFPKFLTGTVNPADGIYPRSQFEIGITCPVGGPCPFSGVRLRLDWVCPGDPVTTICSETDFFLTGTVNGKLVFNPGNTPSVNSPFNRSVPAPPCPEGYLIAWVVNAAGDPISFNGLFGEAKIRKAPNALADYNAIAIQAVPPPGFLIPSRPDLAFDSISYQAVGGKVLGDVRYEVFPPVVGGLFPKRTDLTLITLDVLSNRPNNSTFVDFNFYKDDETPLSTSTTFTCYMEKRLTDININLTQGGMSPFGAFDGTCSDGSFTPVSCLGLVIEQEQDTALTIVRHSVQETYNDGVAVSTTFSPSP